MIDLQTIIGRKSSTAVRVNNLYVPANSLSTHLSRFCDPAIFHTDGMENYSLSKSGSLFRVKIRNKYLALCTSHQVGKGHAPYQYEQLHIFDSNRKLLSSSESTSFPTGENSEILDCLAFDFTGQVLSGKISMDRWYHLGNELDQKGVPKPSRCCALGYPGAFNNIDYENSRYDAEQVAVWGKETTAAMPDRLSFRPDPEIDFEPNGMSGGPVFGFHLVDFEPELYFAGIITEATPKMFNFVSRSRLRGLIHNLLSD